MFQASWARWTVSTFSPATCTFSCDIAHAVSLDGVAFQCEAALLVQSGYSVSVSEEPWRSREQRQCGPFYLAVAPRTDPSSHPLPARLPRAASVGSSMDTTTG